MVHSADEHEIIRRAQSGDEEAFESLIILYSPTLFRVVKRIARNTSDAYESAGKYDKNTPSPGQDTNQASDREKEWIN
jgi:hypothetical protein